jgi:hypothetical protein
MKILCALCLVTLLAVLVDVMLFHSRTANAQNTGNYRVMQVDHYGSFSSAGTVVGFSCFAKEIEVFCYAVIKE